MSYWVKHDPARGTIEPGSGRGEWAGPVARSLAAQRGLITFLIPLTSMFALVIAAYVMRRHLGDWQPIPLPWQLWLSTLLLVGSSIAFEQARRAVRRDPRAAPRGALRLAALLAVAFLGSQLWAWQALQAAGYALAANPANSFFYLMSGLHGLHLIGGLVAWRSVRRALRDGAAEKAAVYLQLCAIYWHFLLAVWLTLFGVLLLVS